MRTYRHSEFCIRPTGIRLLQAKKFFQAECKSRKQWDDPLDPVNQHRWLKWLNDLPKLEQFEIKRCLVPEEFGKIIQCQLHHFADASQEAYGSVSYLRLVSAERRIHCAFLIGKSRLAPVKQMTIPRLELSAAVMSVRMDRMLCREMRMDIQESSFWTDSMIVLQYIKNCTKRFQTFVANRISVIHDGSSPVQWRHVSSDVNPADDASRGLGAQEMITRERWKRGPEFLWQEEEAWPSAPDEMPENA